MNRTPSSTLPRVCLVIVLMLCGRAVQAQKAVRQVEIQSSWGGLGTPQNATVVILRKDQTFLSGDKKVAPALVQALVTALAAPLVAEPTAENLGVTPAWLQANVGALHPRARTQATKTTAGQQRFFTESFTNPNLVAKVLPGLFRYAKFDDLPSVSVDVVFEDGSRLQAESHSWYVFMLPWKVDGQSGETYNADVSLAVSALLPPKTVNKERLAGQAFLPELVDAVIGSIETEWNLLGSEERTGDALNKLRTVYQVTAAEITPYHHPEYGTATHKGEPEEMNLHVTARRPALPAGVTDAVVLRYANGTVEGVDRFLESAAKYEDRALSVRWLGDYIREHPWMSVRISYVHDRSFGDKAMRSFTADMKALGREDLMEKVRAQQADISLLLVGNTYSESYWLVFPDRHMMLWRYGGPSGLLKWTPKDFGRGQCGGYGSISGGCSGREVTPDGALTAVGVPRDQRCMAEQRVAKDGKRTGDDLFPVMDRGRGGFIDRTGKVVIPLCFEKVGDFSEGLARFERDGNWGYIDTSGSVVIEPKFPWAQEFSEGLARVMVSGSPHDFDARWGFIDKTGKVVIPPLYPSLAYGMSNIGSDTPDDAFHDGLAKVEVERKTGYIDKTGKLVIPAELTYAYPFSEGLAAGTKSPSGDDGWGYIDTTGKWVVAPRFEWARSFHEGLGPVNRRRDCGYVDRMGVIVVRPQASPGERECDATRGDFADGLARWKSGGKYGFIDRSGRVVISPGFDETSGFSEGLAAVEIGGKWGYIDKTGRRVIEPMALSSVEDFHHGLAMVATEDGRYGYIDRTGKYVWTPTFLYID